MRLTQLFSGEKQVEDRGKSQSASFDSAGKAPADHRALVPGQTIRGEVISRLGSEIQIRLAGDMLLNARMEGNLNLETGRNVTFQVKGNGAFLMLNPLFENTAADETVLRALEMASLPVNEQTVAMTRGLMERGLPIDKNTLMRLYREISAFPQAELSDILDLHELGIPVEENSLTRLASYRNLTYRLGDGVEQLGGDLLQVLSEMVREGKADGAAKIWQAFWGALPEGGSEAVPKETAVRMLQQAVLMSGGAEAEGYQPVQGEAKDVLFRTGNFTENTASPQTMEQQAVSPEGLQTLLKESGTTTIDLVGQLLRFAVSGGGFGEKALKTLSAVLSDRALRKTIQESIQRQFSIAPDEVAEPEKVEQLYERLDRQVRLLGRALEENGQSGSRAFQTANSLSGNLDFLQQINHAYSYVQLPLRLQQGRAHGDLYVFTNKKHLADANGKISALLHLDMEHLGSLDVYVSMEQEKVGTRFYVENEEMLLFLEQHMELLTNRLKERGYDCSFTAQIGEGRRETGGIRQLLKREGRTPLAQYAFDMRA